jgi:hypothetical protein
MSISYKYSIGQWVKLTRTGQYGVIDSVIDNDYIGYRISGIGVVPEDELEEVSAIELEQYLLNLGVSKEDMSKHVKFNQKSGDVK